MSCWRRDSNLRYCSPTPKILLFGAVLLLLAGLFKVFEMLAVSIVSQFDNVVIIDLSKTIIILLALSGLSFLTAILENIFRSPKRNIKYMVRKSLCDFRFGNPLHLRDGEIEPFIRVVKTSNGYKIVNGKPLVPCNNFAELVARLFTFKS